MSDPEFEAELNEMRQYFSLPRALSPIPEPVAPAPFDSPSSSQSNLHLSHRTVRSTQPIRLRRKVPKVTNKKMKPSKSVGDSFFNLAFMAAIKQEAGTRLTPRPQPPHPVKKSKTANPLSSPDLMENSMLLPPVPSDVVSLLSTPPLLNPKPQPFTPPRPSTPELSEGDPIEFDDYPYPACFSPEPSPEPGPSPSSAHQQQPSPEWHNPMPAPTWDLQWHFNPGPPLDFHQLHALLAMRPANVESVVPSPATSAEPQWQYSEDRPTDFQQLVTEENRSAPEVVRRPPSASRRLRNMRRAQAWRPTNE